MSENKQTRGELVKALRSLNAIPVENRVRSGTPDVNYAGGWIECKRLGRWPKGADTNPVKFPHPLLQTQKIWIAKRCAIGGTVFICAQVGGEWFFFRCPEGLSLFERMTRPEMHEKAEFYMKTMQKERLVDFVKYGD